MAVLRYLSAFTLALFACAANINAAQVNVDTGTLTGSTAREVISFTGIPYAHPPVQALRWQPPQRVQRWTGVREATALAPDCMQELAPWMDAPIRTAPSEDCLYLNVWRPALDSRKPHPVVVWFHGGGFVNGGSSAAVFDGGEFARRGVVLVTFNYRLGRFGFFAHPALSRERGDGPLANYGLMDQIAALEWVQRNIAVFDGDPHNVTIFGESAGGMSVLALATSERARGLFHKAIVQSGGGRPGLLSLRPLRGGDDSAEMNGRAFAREAGIEGNDAHALARLRALPAERLAKGLTMLTMVEQARTYVGGPVLDGRIIAGMPGELLARNRSTPVPLMIGATSMDIGPVEGNTLEQVLAPFGANAAKARAVYDPDGRGSLADIAARSGGDRYMVEPARYLARLFTDRGARVYLFRFSYVAESMRPKWTGAPHATDVPYVFNTLSARYGKAVAVPDASLAQAMQRYWIAFATTGMPEVTGLPAWPIYERASDVLMNFTNEGPVAGPDPWRARLDITAASQEH